MGLIVDIKKRLGNFFLDVKFSCDDGTMGLLGASGCGKSMALKCIAGIEKPDEGRIVLDDVVLFDSAARINLPARERRVGYLFQQYALFPNMTVRENILSGCIVGTKRERIGAAQKYIEAFQLKDVEDKKPNELSGGQQQRVALSRMLAAHPKLILLDEPFSALDSYLKWELELELTEQLERTNKMVLLVTHDRGEIHRLCKQVCVMSGGKSASVQDTTKLFSAPSTRAACLLSGCKNISKVTKNPDGTINALEWGISLRLPKQTLASISDVGIRSHGIRLVDKGGENRMHCEVERVIFEPFSAVIILSTNGRGRLRLEIDKAQWHALNNPKATWVELPMEELLPLN